MGANHWLVKSEPGEWSWADQCRDGVAEWDGVKNAQAQKHMRAMAKGDPVLFYHSGRERAVVGVAEVARGPYPDPDDPAGKRVRVDLRARESLERPVPLDAIKADERLAHLPLVRQPRLSVMPVDADSFRRIRRRAESPPA